jgi:hypothetical protein
MLRINSPDPISTTKAIATWATISNRRALNRRECASKAASPSLSEGARSCPELLQRGRQTENYAGENGHGDREAEHSRIQHLVKPAVRDHHVTLERQQQFVQPRRNQQAGGRSG